MRLLITGAGSYIGTAFENWLKEQHKDVSVDSLDMKDEHWRDKDFSGYDAVFHVAGIAHADTGRANAETRALYYCVNTDLAVETAKKAKADGVGQFIFMSSIIVYGESAGLGKRKCITAKTQPAPANFYGNSKLRAERGILPLQDEHFKVAVLRPPMIYGKDSKGNFPLLVKLAGRLPFFPTVKNERSMLYVENLCAFLWEIITRQAAGIFFPQNREYASTVQIVKEISEVTGKKLIFTKLLNPFIKLASILPGKPGGLSRKAFGNLTYAKELSCFDWGYTQYDLRESIHKSL